MKKALLVFFLCLSAGSSVLLAQPAKILLLEPETERVQFSLACDAYTWMGEGFAKYKDYLGLVDLKQARESLAVKNIFLSKCKTNEEFYKAGGLLHADELVYTKLISTDFQYIYSTTVYDIKSKAILYQKETAKNITYRNGFYEIVVNSAKEMADSIYKTFLIKHKNDTTLIKDNTLPKGIYFDMDKIPELVKKVAPVYPKEAKANGIQGKVIIYLLIDIDGKVKQVDIAASSGSVLLDEAAKEASSKFEFTPAILSDNKPVRVWVLYPVTFKLD